MKRFLTLILATALPSMGQAHDIDAHATLPPPPSAAPIVPASAPPQAFTQPTPTGDWWRAFGSTELDALVDAALAHNNDIAIADAALRQARELGKAAGGALLPQVDASYQAQRARVSDALATPLLNPDATLYTLHTAQLNMSYMLDLFGGTRSRVRSARAAAETQHQKYEAARMTVVANLVVAVIQHASLVEQRAAAQSSVDVNRDILQAILRRQQIGAVGAADVAAQQTMLAAAEGALAPLARAEAHQVALVATLIGVPAGSPPPPLPTLTMLNLPRDLPVIVPSDVVARRPDILAAKAQLEGAGADVHTAIAARLPSIQLSANVGGAAQKFGGMFDAGNPFWALIGGITQPIFHAGALRHQQHAAEAALDGAKAQYRATVLQAFSDVSDALAGLRTDADALDAASRAADASQKALVFAQRQLALGDIGALTLLNVTTADVSARLQLIQARAARLSDTVALCQAAGGPISAGEN